MIFIWGFTMANYDYYRIFYYVAQYQSFTKAAEMLRNNQPNITRYINNLESELGCKLFIRSNRGVKLTPEGENLFEHVAIAQEHLRLGESELQKEKELDTGLITLGVSEIALRIFLLDRLESFHEKYPHVRLRITNHTTPEALESLKNDLCDFAVVTTPIDSQPLLQETVLDHFEAILIGGKKYKEYANKRHNLSEFKDVPFISLTNQTGTRAFYNHYFLDNAVPFHPDIEVSTTDQIIPLIKHNLGIAFYPRKLAQEYLDKGEVFEIPLIQALPHRAVCLVKDPNKSQSIASSKLIESLMQEAIY